MASISVAEYFFSNDGISPRMPLRITVSMRLLLMPQIVKIRTIVVFALAFGIIAVAAGTTVGVESTSLRCVRVSAYDGSWSMGRRGVQSARQSERTTQ